MKVGVYSNVNLDAVCRKLGSTLGDVQKSEGYGDWYFSLMRNGIKEDVAFIILDGFELFRNVDNIGIELKNYIKILENITSENKTKKIFVSTIDVYETKASIDSKISRGTFSASFFLQCLSVIGCSKVEIEEYESNLLIASESDVKYEKLNKGEYEN